MYSRRISISLADPMADGIIMVAVDHLESIDPAGGVVADHLDGAKRRREGKGYGKGHEIPLVEGKHEVGTVRIGRTIEGQGAGICGDGVLVDNHGGREERARVLGVGIGDGDRHDEGDGFEEKRSKGLDGRKGDLEMGFWGGFGVDGGLPAVSPAGTPVVEGMPAMEGRPAVACGGGGSGWADQKGEVDGEGKGRKRVGELRRGGHGGDQAMGMVEAVHGWNQGPVGYVPNQ